jgi:hypothetical protein
MSQIIQHGVLIFYMLSLPVYIPHWHTCLIQLLQIRISCSKGNGTVAGTLQNFLMLN